MDSSDNPLPFKSPPLEGVDPLEMARFNLQVLNEILSWGNNEAVDLSYPTSAMTKAGAAIIAHVWGLCGDDIASDLARDVFKAMWAAHLNQNEGE